MFGAHAIAEDKPAVEAPASGGSSETQIDEPRKLPGEPVGVKPLSPGDTPGQGSAGLNAGQGSAVGAGLRFSVGGKRKTKGKVKRDSKLTEDPPGRGTSQGTEK